MATAARHTQRQTIGPRERAIEAFSRGQWIEALRGFDEVLAESPVDAELHNYRARVLDALGRHEEALVAIEGALAINPHSAADLKNRGILLRKLSRDSDALASFEAASAMQPTNDDVLIRRAQVLNVLERREEALRLIEAALARRPAEPTALNTRGMILERLGRYDEAMLDFDRLLAVDSCRTDGLNNRGMICARLGRYAESLACYDESLSVEPDQPQAIYNRSLVRLALGDWAQGFVEFESRWSISPLKAARLETGAPAWLGRESIAGKRILVYHEQGYGDTLQCARYVARLTELGATVFLAVPPTLIRLMSTVSGAPMMLALGGPFPAHDFCCPLMSLPLSFKTTPVTIPEETPYLWANPRDIASWKTRLGPRRRFRIGLAWSGRQYPPINYPRDIPLEALTPFFELDADLVSLQAELSARDRVSLAIRSRVDFSSAEALKDFGDTAALIHELDLIITVDTAVAHLAGALGKQVWLLNRYASCWRWGQEGERTKWYPSMRIFRQSGSRDWRGVIERAREAAVELIEQDGKANSKDPATKLRPPATSDKSVGAASVVREKIRLVCATRRTAEEFLANAPLGRSLPLYRTFPRRQRIELRLFKQNVEGLPTVYNRAIEESRADPAVLVFIHDDVYLSDYYWADHLFEGLRTFDIVGLAGNRRCLPGQASWMYLDDQFRRDSDENLSGVIGHGEGFPNLRELSIYGEPYQKCKLLDGVMLAVRSAKLLEKDLRFDPRFTFDFYDLDFCRQAELRGITMGTWAISAIHASAGKLGSVSWRSAYQVYLEKYREQRA